MKHVLFLCSQNRLRSPTAETIFADRFGFHVRSAGLSNDAVVPATVQLVKWADYIFVMEPVHRKKLLHKFKSHLDRQRVICLDIPDEYAYMDESLVELLKQRLDIFFQNP